jgi:hypothetical protein
MLPAQEKKNYNIYFAFQGRPCSYFQIFCISALMRLLLNAFLTFSPNFQYRIPSLYMYIYIILKRIERRIRNCILPKKGPNQVRPFFGRRVHFYQKIKIINLLYSVQKHLQFSALVLLFRTLGH